MLKPSMALAHVLDAALGNLHLRLCVVYSMLG